LIERWVKALGVDEAAAFARANNEVAPVAFRIINEPVNRSSILDLLESAGAVVRPSEITPAAWRATGAAGLVHELALAGRIYIQDEASQLVAHVLAARSGDRVLDVCAAPGSKTTHIADLMRTASFHAEASQAESLLVAGDLHGHRLRTVVASAGAQQLNNIQCVTLDALQALPFPESSFDRVLVDAPCTGTGTLRHNPEIRWRISPGDIEDLASRQIRILWNAAQMVKPGGRLVYSTCSVEPEENEQVITKFIEASSAVEQLHLSINPSLITVFGAARVWPHRDGAEGFFIAAFERRG
jgi:16S rRNA (cytosine967-C5)-methyltransferase